MYVATAPIVGVGHTFDLPAGDNPVFQQYPCMVVFGFNTASVIYRSQTGASSTSSATLKPGAIATTRPNALLIAGISHSGIEGPPPISDDFLQPVGADSDGTAALSYGCAGAYRVVVSAGTADPEWTIAPDGASTALLAFQDVADDVISRHPRLLRRLRIH
jgi:hypothetical protein